MSRRDIDLTVVGGGPAGCAAAIHAAAAGLAVTVVDKATFPRDKTCGDGLTTGAMRELAGLGLELSSLVSLSPVRSAWVRVPDGTSARFRLPDDGIYAASVKRIELDQALVRLAQDRGVSVLQGTAVTGIKGIGTDSVEVAASTGESFVSNAVVAADGMWSKVARILGTRDSSYRGEWHAGRQYLDNAGPLSRDLWVWFEADLKPGYAWSFPLSGGMVNAGFGMFRKPGETPGNAASIWEDLRSRPHIAEVLGPRVREVDPIRTWPIPADIGGARLSALDGRVLFVGDAARASDFLTGEGIAQALETGRLAAEAIAAGGAHPGFSYSAAVDRSLVLDDRASRFCAGVLSGSRGINAWIRVATSSSLSRRVFTRWMFEDLPRSGPLDLGRLARRLRALPPPY